MAWKFQSYEDGYKFLTPYQFQRFDHEHLFGIMLNFILITNSVTILFLLPGPIILRKSGAIDAERDSKMRDSMASFDSATLPEPTTRPSELVAPLLFARESSVTGRKSNLSINHSTTGFEHENRGPTVMFKDVTYR